jgi:hypothetical protein
VSEAPASVLSRARGELDAVMRELEGLVPVSDAEVLALEHTKQACARQLAVVSACLSALQELSGKARPEVLLGLKLTIETAVGMAKEALSIMRRSLRLPATPVAPNGRTLRPEALLHSGAGARGPPNKESPCSRKPHGETDK